MGQRLPQSAFHGTILSAKKKQKVKPPCQGTRQVKSKGGGTEGGMWEQPPSAVRSSKARQGDCYAASDYGSCNVPWPDMRHRVPKPDHQRHRRQSQTDRQQGSE